jgi:hypothetical protein
MNFYTNFKQTCEYYDIKISSQLLEWLGDAELVGTKKILVMTDIIELVLREDKLLEDAYFMRLLLKEIYPTFRTQRDRIYY